MARQTIPVMIVHLYLLNIIAVAKESSEESAISSEISSHESFENLASHSTQSTIKKCGNKNQRPNQGYHSHRIRGRGPRVTNTNTTNSVHSGR